MKNSFILLSIVFGFALIISCNKIDPIIEFNSNYNEDEYGPAPTFDPAGSELIVQNVLLEEFTGHKCGFCPPATELAEELVEEHGDRLSLVVIHAGSLATTSEPLFTQDWTCEEGNDFWFQSAFDFNPMGRINRKESPQFEHFYTTWENGIDDELGNTPPCVLQMKTEFIPGQRDLNIHVYTEFLQNMSEDCRLAVLITESKLYGYQQDDLLDPPYIENYEFNHMLRGSVTGAFGLKIAETPQAGSAVQNDYTYRLNPDWDSENISVVAMIIEQESGHILNVIHQEL